MKDNRDQTNPGLIGPHGGYRELKSYQVAANSLICLIHQINYLLDQQLRQLERQFLAEGGFTERLYRARSEARQRRHYPD